MSLSRNVLKIPFFSHPCPVPPRRSESVLEFELQLQVRIQAHNCIKHKIEKYRLIISFSIYVGSDSDDSDNDNEIMM